MPYINRTTAVAADAQCITGIETNLAGASSLPLTGTSFTPSALVLLFQSEIDAASALLRAEADLHARVQEFRALRARVSKVRQALRQLVINTFGEQSPVLADFGFAPPTRRPLTPEEKLVKAARARATRAARGTKGPKARLAIQGDVKGVVVTPVTQPPAPPAVKPV